MGCFVFIRVHLVIFNLSFYLRVLFYMLLIDLYGNVLKIKYSDAASVADVYQSPIYVSECLSILGGCLFKVL